MIYSEFPEVASFWDLGQLFVDLSRAKQCSDRSPGNKLSNTEWLYLQGILAQCAPAEIANHCHVSSGTVRSCLSDRIYPYVKLLIEQKTGEGKEIKHWSEVAPVLEQLGYKQRLFSENPGELSSSWVGAPEIDVIFGRETELKALQRSILSEERRIVMLTGAGGIGKTALAVKLAKTLEKEHHYQVLWIAMSAAPSAESIIAQIQRLWGSQVTSPALTLEEQWQDLIQGMANTPWLVVLDGMETILEHHKYTSEHQSYKSLFRQACETKHLGRFLVTSSQKVTNLCVLEDKGLPVKLCRLEGLSKCATGKLLEHLNVECKHAQDCEQVRRVYNGNPQFIRFFATSIREIFNGKLIKFTELDTILLDEQMQLLLDMQLQCLSHLEKRIMRDLAEANQPLSVAELRARLNGLVSTSELINVLRSLKEREFCEQMIGKTKEEMEYQLRPLIYKYLADYLNCV
ncbi:ATP-binding protein [Leptolyngbya sp. CCNP1308]|uniref:ATP-binding protein n=1 Tax=Leptolyngbya sp. CCNP1308 TaxID=3110255 RepID=UPI002B1ED503|nr:ATP-binding protein [Leptolyngbya sp. CCNP1308]MEA5451837.1 ATP-binding protein [Leptolyngbya sp. CCNP1308]